MMSGKEHKGLTAIKKWVAEITELEAEHSPVECGHYAPGRCPACLRIRSIEQEQIEREIDIIEEDVAEIVCAREPEQQAVEAAMRLLAEADVYRCHPRGEWPRSVAEIADGYLAHWIPAMLRRRLGGELAAPFIIGELAPRYQRFYHEACLQRWELVQFEYYVPPGEDRLPLSHFQC